MFLLLSCLLTAKPFFPVSKIYWKESILGNSYLHRGDVFFVHLLNHRVSVSFCLYSMKECQHCLLDEWFLYDRNYLYFQPLSLYQPHSLSGIHWHITLRPPVWYYVGPLLSLCCDIWHWNVSRRSFKSYKLSDWGLGRPSRHLQLYIYSLTMFGYSCDLFL